jgi:uncharacterized protein
MLPSNGTRQAKIYNTFFRKSNFMFDENKIKSDLSSLSFKKQLVFAASCCERLLPFYFAFTKIENWGNPTLLRNALDKIWEIAKTEEFSKDEIAELSKYCEASTPDSNDFSSIYTYQAQNACIVISLTLDFCEMRENSFLVDVARILYESVEMYLDIVNDPELKAHASDSRFDKWILTAPMLQAEIKYQQEDLKFLSETELDNTLIEQMRFKSSRKGVQPQRRGLL